MDVDKLLNYEQECYDQGYKEGVDNGKVQGRTEGRELGIQTGFLKYMPMGVLQSRAKHWGSEHQSDSIDQLKQLVATPDLSNDPQNVDDLDLKLKMAKNKAKLISSSLKSYPVTAHDQKITYQRGADEVAAIEDMY